MNVINSNGEKLRLAALQDFQILDTLPEREFDDITLLASQICETPISAVSLIDAERQWFKSHVGLDVSETPRDCAFCDYAIEEDQLFIVNDAASDSRFRNNPLVTKSPHIRFYAGAPLVTSDGHKLGTLCVIDQKPRTLSDSQERALSALARSVMNLIEARNLKDIPSNENDQKSSDNLFGITQESSKNANFFNRHLKHYLIATLIMIVVTLVKLFLDNITQVESPFLLFACATLLAAWRGGFGPGLYATLVSLVIVNYFFIPSHFGFSVENLKQGLLLLIFTAQGVFISALCASRLRSEKLLYQTGKDLEKRIANRTKQLAQANNELKEEIHERSVLQEDLRQARDAALETARLKSEFLANMSHEIRTPMNGVIGMTGLLLETKLDNEQTRFAQVIRSSGESLLTIINDILDFSKVEAGKLELETLDFDLRDTIESLIDIFSARAQEQQNELAALIYSDVPLLLRGDAGRIRQILTNLIGNAIKFTKCGDIVVRVKKLRESANHIELNFSVTDTGEGISKEVQTRLFQPFTQSDASTTRRFGGTGLGLSISKRLVEMMNGEIGLQSEIGKGATFWFNITLEKQEANVASVFESSNTSANLSHLSGRRVLIVDDNEINREVLIHQTKAWKMEAVEVRSGMDALDLLEKDAQLFDLVILDLQMPEIDGLETARRIVSVREKQQAVLPIIMISSSGFILNKTAKQELGIKVFLNKPYRQSDLLESILQSLNFNHEGNSEETDIHITAIPESAINLPTNEKAQRILLVEDNTVNQMVAQNMLKKIGYQVDVVANGYEALQSLEIIPYDLILMDCQMPEMDGYEATRAIRARDWNAARLPVIALTAHATDGERDKCLQAGMNDYISKPVEKENLRRIVAQWISKTNGKNTAAENLQISDKDFLSEDESTTVVAIPAVDIATLDEITDNDNEMRREIVEIYLEQTVSSLSEMERAISIEDSQRLYELAHKTLGGSAICGMTAIVEPMRKLERMGYEGKINEAAPILAQAQNAFAAIDKECRKIL